MAIRVPLSQVRYSGFADQAAFDQAVNDFIEKLTEHSRTIGEPRPTSHPLVEAAVARLPPPPDLMPDEDPAERFLADYVVVDDTPPAPPPPPPPTLAERKAALAQTVMRLSAEAAEAAWPALTRRLADLKYGAAAMTPEQARTPEQIETIASYTAKQAQMMAINLHLAELEVEIFSLTDETIDVWQPGAFPV